MSFVRPWGDELNTAQSLVTNLRNAVDLVKHHKEWLATVGADGDTVWEGQGASANDIALLRGAFDQLTQGTDGIVWAYAQNLYRGQ